VYRQNFFNSFHFHSVHACSSVLSVSYSLLIYTQSFLTFLDMLHVFGIENLGFICNLVKYLQNVEWSGTTSCVWHISRLTHLPSDTSPVWHISRLTHLPSDTFPVWHISRWPHGLLQKSTSKWLKWIEIYNIVFRFQHQQTS